MLELKNICYRYGKNLPDVLNNISCTFEKGKLYGVVGQSGAGKSTLISMIGGLDRPTGGEILFDGRNISSMNMNEYRSTCVGVMFQSFNLLLRWTALENVLISLYLSGRRHEGPAEALRILESMGINGEKARRPILQLSGGEQQRVAIARAVTGNPKVLICDEPTGNLDEDNQKKIMDIIRRLADTEQKCAIVVTHSSHVMQYADEIIKIADGRISA